MATAAGVIVDTAPLALKVIQMIIAAEPAVVSAIHNLLMGTGTADDLAVLKADAVVWQSIADKAQAEVNKAKNPPAAVTEMPTPIS